MFWNPGMSFPVPVDETDGCSLPPTAYRDSNETPNCDAFIFVTATVLFNALAIFLAPFLSFAIVFNVR